MTKSKTKVKPRTHKGVGCRECGGCAKKTDCRPFRGKLGSYQGIRMTADGFDCALPVSIDTHNTCSFRCMYCFSNYLMRDPERKTAYVEDGGYRAKQMPLAHLERFLKGELGGIYRTYRGAIDEVSEDKRKCPVQWGALGDPFDNIERQQGWALGAMPIFEACEQPVRISTKGAAVILEKEYLRAFHRRPELYWVAWSCISIDDDVLMAVDKGAPPPSMRLKAIKKLSKMGVKCSLRFRPALPGISDRTKKHPKAWRDLLRAARDAGAIAISFEIAFVPGMRPKHVSHMWKEIEKVAKIPIVKHYEKTTSPKGACLRSSAAWKEDITLAIYEESKKLGFSFGISDPHWKELNDHGCCCGIDPKDPIFGGWQRKNATNAVVRARKAFDKGKTLLISAKDGVPGWADKVNIHQMVCITGPRGAVADSQITWGDKLRETWNDLRSPRGPLQYFEGILIPVKRAANGDVLYRYQPREHRDASKETPYWRI